MGVAMLVPIRVRQYQQGMISLRWNPDVGAGAGRREERAGAGAGELGQRTAGAAVGAGRVAAGGGALLPGHRSRACWSRPSAAWSSRAPTPPASLAALEPLVGDSVRLVRSEISSDPTLRRLPGAEYTPLCNERLGRGRSRASRSSRPTSCQRRTTCASCATSMAATACCSPATTARSTCSSRRARRSARCRSSIRCRSTHCGRRGARSDHDPAGQAVATAHTELPKGSFIRVRVRASRRETR